MCIRDSLKSAYCLANRQTGKSLVVALWESEEAMRASEAEIEPRRKEPYPTEENAVIDDKWFTVEQIAERLQVTEETVRRWLRSGELVGQSFGGRTDYRIREAEVNAFLERGEGKAAA